MKAVCCALLLGFLCLQALGEEFPSICNLPSDKGRCEGYIPSYYFNWQTGKCEEFIYGGCGGNENRFNEIKECRAACASGSDV